MKVNLLLITLDSFLYESLRHLKEHGVVNLDRLFANGFLFNTCVPDQEFPQTAPNHASILTGLGVGRHGVRYNGDILRSTTLAEILRSHGYRTAAAVGVWSLGSSKGFDRGFEVYHNYSAADPVLQVMAKNKMGKHLIVNTALKAVRAAKKLFRIDNEKSDRSTRRMLGFFRDGQKGNFFSWLHFFDLHTNSEDDYWKGLRKIDANIGKLLERFRQIGCLGNTLIVITADHGIRFEGGKGREDKTRVPLLFYSDRLAAGELSEPVRNVDIMPTVLDLCGVIPAGTDGRVILRWN
jgi:arylsulfatase A-like enzyme